MSKSNRSRGSQFLHDLVTVDFDKVDISYGVRVATIIAPLLVIGLITGQVGESSLVIIGAAWVISIDPILPTSQRTRILLFVSVILAGALVIGELISMVDYLVLPLLGLGLFVISYLRVFPGAYIVLFFVAVNFVLGVASRNVTLTSTGLDFLLVLIGGLWAILTGAIFPAHKFSKRHRTTNQSVQEQRHQQQQSQAKLTRQDRYKLFTSNLSVRSQYFQFALALALTGVVGLLITQLFNLSESKWVVETILLILMPAQLIIFMAFDKIAHRIIGTIIGVIITIVIINTVDNQWLLALLTLLFTGIYVSFTKITNYAFQVIFLTVMVLLLDGLANPSKASITTYDRIQNTLLGCSLALVTAFIIWVVPKIKSTQALRKVD